MFLLGLWNLKLINMQCFTCPPPPFSPSVCPHTEEDCPLGGECQVGPHGLSIAALEASREAVWRSWLNITRAAGLVVMCTQTQW